MRLQFLTLMCIPSLIVQGYWVKKNTPRLAEASGERQGVVGQGKALSILILGDSAAAGVGVEQQENALLGALLSNLKNDFTLHYQLEAKTGDTTLQVLEKVQTFNYQHFDVVITSVGVNDVTQLVSAKKWIRQQQLFYQTIENKFTPTLVLVTGVPPLNLFPALPNPLGWLFGQYSGEMNRLLIDFMKTKQHYQLIQFDLTHFKALNLQMAVDGFHPSKEIYQLWANELAKKIKLQF